MAKRHVKKGDEVVVIAGSARGSRGKVIEVLPGKSRVIVEGLHMIKKHTRRSQQAGGRGVAQRGGGGAALVRVSDSLVLPLPFAFGYYQFALH